MASSAKLHGMKSSGLSKSPSTQLANIDPIKTIATIFSAPLGRSLPMTGSFGYLSPTVRPRIEGNRKKKVPRASWILNPTNGEV